ncbi:hypothetical protein E2C01_002746 [Portunus trituberculatus]|uniref:Uncharacterized protein n=1 Tax=Portunus trituberculatus TaxID=210409 RepID=A0A5B7CKK1_PORTR|nr:hypothetical protein [Portunus trituberculatus]
MYDSSLQAALEGGNEESVWLWQLRPPSIDCIPGSNLEVPGSTCTYSELLKTGRVHTKKNPRYALQVADISW